jgi:hypothetical protein
MSESCFCGVHSDEMKGLQFAVQSPNGLSHAEPVTILYCLICDSPNLEGQVPLFISPKEQGGPVIPQGTWYPLCHLLRLAGLWWRYSSPLPTWRARSMYVYPPVNQSVCLGVERL